MTQEAAVLCVRDLLANVQPTARSLALPPLAMHPLQNPSARSVEVVHVREALRKKTLEIGEMRKPTVPTVRVLNRGKKPVFFPAGAVLRGGGQTRIVTTSTLVLAGAEVGLPVRCVEASRWNPHKERAFREVTVAPLSFKGSKQRRDVTARVARRPRAQDQSETWQEVDAYLSARQTVSSTRSLDDAMQRAARASQEQRDAESGAERAAREEALESAGGLAVSRKDKELVSLDLFGARELAEEGVQMAVESAEFEGGGAGRAAPADRDALDRLLDLARFQLAHATWAVRNEGPGTLVDFQGALGLNGSALIHEGVVLQASLSWTPEA